MDIYVMDKEHPLWEKTADFAQVCSWKAGPFLADMMRSGKICGIERVIAACEGDDILGFCTLSEKDELPDIYDYTPFIGFVFVDEKARGKRLSEKMIEAASGYAAGNGYEYVYILTGEEGLYEKYGFEKIGDIDTIYGSTDQLFRKRILTGNEE